VNLSLTSTRASSRSVEAIRVASGAADVDADVTVDVDADLGTARASMSQRRSC
jgi:hypothetical protein